MAELPPYQRPETVAHGPHRLLWTLVIFASFGAWIVGSCSPTPIGNPGDQDASGFADGGVQDSALLDDASGDASQDATADGPDAAVDTGDGGMDGAVDGGDGAVDGGDGALDGGDVPVDGGDGAMDAQPDVQGDAVTSR